VGRLCPASDSGMLHPDSRGQSYPNVAGHHQQDGVGLRVCGAQGQCSVRGPRALKNVVGCGCVLDASLFI
jgi:hypothetical protein